MPLFQWSGDYSVGVGAMDRDHQKLFDLLNKLHDAMIEGKATPLVADIIKELLDYTKYHFEAEEKLMEKVSYPGLSEQKNAHQKFIGSIEDYKDKADKGLSAFLSTSMSIFLTDWLKSHIGVMDKKYQKDMNAQGIT
ncbi:bacteriohemerythrin [Desulfonema magnum]|uniref:Bacteriaohemerythrin n=1 Tax=Desulfonema magnum TaxID=45655 RepID=A0A975GS61_9BACT|nr:bacteriohemerythrin [Desulfonema magnum]QTA91694.1 Bacteriaohemerythrin [Desulfonema magnum]